ncbi:MAG: prepilin-type N-terminal cleavage/methylation domain-containing protein [Candidimonas sp.]|nr:prepilin-type N-terminal cleavage/methylation domain-containing protein [Candidimonas sp.]
MSVPSFARQAGFSLVEVSIVTAIVLLLAIIGIPAIGGYVVENKVPKVGQELARFILQTKVNAPNGTATPYAGIATSNLANLVRDSSIFSVSGVDAATRVLHGLGADGEVSVAEADAGAAFSITLSKVHNAACPSIASVMHRVADVMTVAADGQAAATVKDDATHYSALTTESHCAKGENNTFVFTVS